MALNLYLIRHGETEWTLANRHTGQSDIPLTPNGIEEAKELGPHLLSLTFSQVLTSPLHRAQQTCQLVGLTGIPKIEPDLAEWNYGDYEGKKSVDIRQQRPNWDVFQDGCPNGEMPSQILTRVDRLIARLRKLEGNVALFSHGQLGGVLGARWIGLPLAAARHFPLGTASVSVLSHDPHHLDVAVIALWNFISHPISPTVHSLPLGSTMTLKQRAIQRWENEGGEIPTA
jgi:broad specificity phosphatase PhoE